MERWLGRADVCTDELLAAKLTPLQFSKKREEKKSLVHVQLHMPNLDVELLCLHSQGPRSRSLVFSALCSLPYAVE